MPELQIAELFQIRSRFLRSAHLERDFQNPSAMDGYVLSPHARSSLERLTSGLAHNSGQRAWRITGDYGSGKSSFALLLAHVLAGRSGQLPASLRNVVDFKKLGVARQHLLPILVTGSHEPMATALARAVLRSIPTGTSRWKTPAIVGRVRNLVASNLAVPDAAVLDLVREVGSWLRDLGAASGLLVVIDELGKFLEFAALHPDRQDVYLLQQLAETATRSKDAPLFLVGLLHQGFSVYADQLSPSAQKEWEKVAGRFEELIFGQPLEETAGLIADALNLKLRSLKSDIREKAESDMDSAISLGWYGPNFSRRALMAQAPRFYPLHPTVLPVLVRMFSRFGQNERSLFSFLLSPEPQGLQAFSQRNVGLDGFYRLHHLYDYARSTFGARLGLQSYRSHWNQIEAVVESYRSESDLDLQLLKTVGLLNLIDSSTMIATERSLVGALTAAGAFSERQVKNALHTLQNKTVLYYRGIAGGYCLWPHTSVNLQRAYDDASRAVPATRKVSAAIEECLETRPIVARRHYVETGNLRYFEVRYLPVERLDEKQSLDLEHADGLILIPLCETDDERGKALRFAQSNDVIGDGQIIIAVPKPLRSLAGLVQEARRWEWVAANTPELNHDPYAAEEVSRQIANARQVLERRLKSCVGLLDFAQDTELQWFHKARPVAIRNGRDLLSKLSSVCEDIFTDAPHISNELVNRRTLSSAAASARMRLIERMFEHRSQPFLGMDPDRKPPEMSIYLSLLKNSEVHVAPDEKHAFRVPAVEHDPCRIRPALERIQEFLESQNEGRVKLSDLFRELRRRPLGIRDGLIPILLAVFVLVHEEDVAIYENGAFLREFAGVDFRRIVKTPESFEIQYCKVRGLRVELFQRLVGILKLEPQAKRSAQLLDVVKPMCVFAAQLTTYAQKSKRISREAVLVREALLNAREPSRLLFHDLPEACGCPQFTESGGSASEVDTFVSRLKAALDELRSAYPELLERIRRTFLKLFDVPGTFDEVRSELAATAGRLLVAVSESRLKGFCMRIADSNLTDSLWIEALGSFVSSKPPSKWMDADEDGFMPELSQFASRFRRVESFAFDCSDKQDHALRLAITQPDGSERERVVYYSEEEGAAIKRIEASIVAQINASGRVGLAAAARVCWKLLSEETGDDGVPNG